MGAECCYREKTTGNTEDIPTDFEQPGTHKIALSKKDLILKISDFYSKYIVVKQLGEGGFGSCFLVRDKVTQEERAAKQFDRAKAKPNFEDSFKNELGILSYVDHPNIAKIYEFCQDEKYYYLITEYCKGGELCDAIAKINNFSEKDAAYIFKQVMCALSYLHELGVCHRDIKLENILLTETNKLDIKLIDFGASEFFQKGDYMTRMIGTCYYIPPEIAKKEPYNEKCDIWSAGVLLYMLMSGYPPFDGNSQREIINNVLKGDFHFNHDEWNNTSSFSRNLIKSMLTYNPKNRPTAAECLKTQFFQQAKHYSNPLSPSIFTNLNSYKKTKQMEQAVLLFLVNQYTNANQVKSLEDAFKGMDSNNDGFLSKEEILLGYNQFSSTTLNRKELEELVEKMDINQNGKIEYTEFLAAAIDKIQLITQERLKEAFNAFDEDRSGTITADELKKALGGTKEYSPELWSSLIAELDKNKDGEIQWEEFQEAMTNLACTK